MSDETEDTRPVRKVTNRTLLIIGDEEILFDPDKLLLSEVVAIEKAAELTWPQVVGGMAIGTASALRAAVWIMRKRQNPKLKLTDVEFNWGDIKQRDPDLRPEYGGVPMGEAFGDELADMVDDAFLTAGDEAPKDPPDEAPTEESHPTEE